MDGICSFADQGRKVRAGLADPSLCRKLTRSRMQLDLHGSANRGQGTWAFLIGSGRHWRVLHGELIGGWTERGETAKSTGWHKDPWGSPWNICGGWTLCSGVGWELESLRLVPICGPRLLRPVHADNTVLTTASSCSCVLAEL